jgi:hypothetical protein
MLDLGVPMLMMFAGLAATGLALFTGDLTPGAIAAAGVLGGGGTMAVTRRRQGRARDARSSPSPTHSPDGM